MRGMPGATLQTCAARGAPLKIPRGRNSAADVGLPSLPDALGAVLRTPPRSNSAAIAELRRQAGTQFDPTVVEAFLKVLGRLEGQNKPTTEKEFEAFPHG